jgi:hypothetical protein
VFDDRVLFYPTIHGRPLAGGFVARLPRAVATLYASDPLLSALLNLSDRDGPSGGIPLPDRRLAAERLRQLGIAFVVLDRNSASPALVRYLEDVLLLTPTVRRARVRCIRSRLSLPELDVGGSHDSRCGSS